MTGGTDAERWFAAEVEALVAEGTVSVQEAELIVRSFLHEAQEPRRPGRGRSKDGAVH